MKKYCRKCGSAINYTSEEPNFCPSCGASLNETASREETSNANTSFAEDPFKIKFSFNGAQKQKLSDVIAGDSESVSVPRGMRPSVKKFSEDRARAVAEFSQDVSKELDRQYGKEEISSTED
jgi:predicted  nucleic acid-binding Zn-ribbon protein